MPDYIHPTDGGMPYTETNLHHLFPEPWNMVTSMLFLAPGIYWLIKLKGFNRNYAFLSSAVWLMLVGCIGGTIYHGLRRWSFFIFMDWGPIALLCLSASVYFWIKLTGRWYYGIIALGTFITTEVLLRPVLQSRYVQVAISINYAIMVLMVVLPLILLLVKTKAYNLHLVTMALLAFMVALFFRIYDSHTQLSTGTHFLWHTFGVIATALMFAYLYRLEHARI